jgi:adenine deaminase
MARYSASGTQTLQPTDDDSTDATALTVAAQSTAHQNRIYEIWFGNIGAPADLVSVYTVSRITAATTTAAGTTVTPSLIDLADRASQSKALENCTTEPTYTANQELLEIPLNHRATFRWVAAPGGELVTPATNNAGVGFKAIHASATTDFRMGAMWEE